MPLAIGIGPKNYRVCTDFTDHSWYLWVVERQLTLGSISTVGLSFSTDKLHQDTSAVGLGYHTVR
jgi:hypothetical protein